MVYMTSIDKDFPYTIQMDDIFTQAGKRHNFAPIRIGAPGKNMETSLMNKEDYRYAQVVQEIQQITRDLSQLKLDMTRVLKEKRHADNTFKASSSKRTTLLNAVQRIKKEIEEIDEEQVLVELARIEAVKEHGLIEAQRKQEANRYQTKVKEIDQHNKLKQDLQLTLYNVSLLQNELTRAKAPRVGPSLLQTVTAELETAKTELANIKKEGFNFMTSMDVIRNELKRIREEKSPFEKEEAKRDLTIQTLNAKILKEKAKLESITAITEKANSVASNLSVTVENLRREAKTINKEKELIIKETEKIKLEIPKTESEIELTEERLEAVTEELKTTKSIEFTALENLKNVIDSTVHAREQTSLNSSTIIITNFEHEYLTGKAGSAEEIADKKVAAAQAWVEALKANEKDILVKIEMSKNEIIELEGKWGQNGENVLASPRRSMYKICSMTPGRRARSQKLLSPATRHAIRSASSGKRKEKGPRNLVKSLDENDELGE